MNRRWPKLPWLLPLLILIPAFTFAPILTNQFVGWDDYQTIAFNPRLKPATLQSLGYYWTHPEGGLFVPVTYSYWLGLAALAGWLGYDVADAPWLFHAASIVLHIGCTLLVFDLLRRVLDAKGSAAIAALLFALHPLQVESVAWACGAKDLLCALLSLLAIRYYILYATPTNDRHSDSLRGVRPASPHCVAGEDPLAFSPGAARQGRGEGSPSTSNTLSTSQQNPHPLPEDRERGSQRPEGSPTPSATPDAPSKRHLWLALLAQALAMLAKPTAVVVPLMAAAMDLWALRIARPSTPFTGTSGKGRAAERSQHQDSRNVAVASDAAGSASGAIAPHHSLPPTRHFAICVLRRILPLMLLSLPCIVWSRAIQESHDATWTPLWTRPLIAADALAFYLQKLLIPWPLTILYGRSPTAVVTSGQIHFTWMIPAAVCAVLVLLRRRAPILLAAGAIFLAGLLPTLGLTNFMMQIYSTVTDHYMYLPMLGVALAAGWIMKSLQAHWPRATCALAAMLLATLAILSLLQTRHWRDSVALFMQAARVTPHSPAAHGNLGRALLQSGRANEALPHLVRAVELSPRSLAAQTSLARGLIELGRFEQADRVLDIAEAMHPGDPTIAAERELLRRRAEPR